MNLHGAARVAVALLLAKAVTMTALGMNAGPSDSYGDFPYAAFLFAIVAWSVAALSSFESSPVLSSCMAAVAAAYSTGWNHELGARVPIELWLPLVCMAVLARTSGSRPLVIGARLSALMIAPVAAGLVAGALPSNYLWSTVLLPTFVAIFLLSVAQGGWLSADRRVRWFLLALTSHFWVGSIYLVLKRVPVLGSLMEGLDLTHLGAVVNVIAGVAAVQLARVTWAERQEDLVAQEMVKTSEDVLNWAQEIYEVALIESGKTLSSDALQEFRNLYRPGAERAALQPKLFLRLSEKFQKALFEKATMAAFAAGWERSLEVSAHHVLKAERAHASEIKKVSPFCPPLKKLGGNLVAA